MTISQLFIAEFCVLAALALVGVVTGGHTEGLIFYIGSIALRILYRGEA